MLFDLLLFVLLLPVILVWMINELMQDFLNFFGWWLFPAVLAGYFGAFLFTVKPAAPDAPFVSLFQVISECTAFGIRLPVWLLILGGLMLFTGATSTRLKRAG